jgi:cytochrome c biogenesis protein CcmG/thiol:disulfide interchange protein DsbE
VDADGRVGIDWGVYGVPETFVVDKSGVIRHKHIGPLSAQDLQQKIMPLVRELQKS